MQVYKKRQHVYEKSQPDNVKTMGRSLLISMILLMVLTTVAFAQGGERYRTEKAWSFGVMGDTRWTLGEDPDEENPNYVNVTTAQTLNEKFIDYGVKFVVQLGNLSDRAGNDAMYTRAEAAQPLYDAGIGFFPLRGKHETVGASYGLDPDSNMNIPAFLEAFPQTRGQGNKFDAANFSSPAIADLNGLSYSFDYGIEGSNARFVIVDVEPTSLSSGGDVPDYGPGSFYIMWDVYKLDTDLTYTEGGVEYTIPANTWFRIDDITGNPTVDFFGFDATWSIDIYSVPNAEEGSTEPSSQISTEIVETRYLAGDQQDWISGQLDIASRGTEHAFVLSHKGLIGANSLGSLFGDRPDCDPADQDRFYASLMDNGVKYMISGQDQIHNRALVESPDGLSDVEQILSAGAGTELDGPAPLTAFGCVKNRETPISQEILNIGYYVYTVDGPRVTVDYYSKSDDDFAKKETWGYSNNGKQFLVAHGESYKVVNDSFNGITAKILGGVNASTATDFTPEEIDDNGTPDDPGDDIVLSAPRPLIKSVNTGWVEKPSRQKNMFGSDILSIWGMADLGTDKTDTYVLSMSYKFKNGWHFRRGMFGIAALDSKGRWRNAVDMNFGGRKRFVIGPYKPWYKLGTYGIDPYTKTVWAVLNYNADFAVTTGINRASYFDWYVQWRLHRMCGKKWR